MNSVRTLAGSQHWHNMRHIRNITKHKESLVQTKILYTRAPQSNTLISVENIVRLARSPECSKVTVFATMGVDGGGYDMLKHGPATNPPLFGALIEIICGWLKINVICDDLIGTYQREPRRMDVDFCLSELEAIEANRSGLVQIACVPANFTSHLDPEDACNHIAELKVIGFSSDTRNNVLIPLLKGYPPRKET